MNDEDEESDNENIDVQEQANNSRKNMPSVDKPDGTYICSRTTEKGTDPDEKSKEFSKNDSTDNLPSAKRTAAQAAKKDKTTKASTKKKS